MVRQHAKVEIADGRGRPHALPEYLLQIILSVLTVVVTARATIISAPMLQPIAFGVIVAYGHGNLLRNPESKKKGLFNAGVGWLKLLMRAEGWRACRPAGNTRKVPANGSFLVHRFMLRLAYLVAYHAIPHELVVNADHTGVMLTQQKGRSWFTASMRKSKDKSLVNMGDKRQFTCLASTSAAGLMLRHALIFAGKGAGSLPQWLPKIRNTHIKAVVYHRRSSVSGMTKRKSEKKANDSSSFTFKVRPSCAASVDLSGIGLFSVTYNHWADDLTSRAYVELILVPYLQKMIWTMHAAGKCKPFGVQRCVLLLDVWWGWLHDGFRSWLRQSYPWLLFLYVPAACTPIGQPMDMGIIAKIKAFLRAAYGRWA